MTLDELMQDLDTRFDFHKATPEQIANMHSLREAFRSLTREIARSTPQCREQSLAFTHLETAMFFTNAGITRPKVPRG